MSLTVDVELYLFFMIILKTRFNFIAIKTNLISDFIDI